MHQSSSALKLYSTLVQSTLLRYCTVLYCTVLYCTVLRCAALRLTVLYCAALCCAVLRCAVLCCAVTVLYCTVLCCTVLYCTEVYCTALHCTALYCTVLKCTVLCCAVLCCAVLRCAVLYWNVMDNTVLYCNYTFVLKSSQFDLTPLHSAPPCSIMLYSTHSLTVSIHPFGHPAIQQHIPSLPSPSPASFICCDFRKPLHSFLNIRTAVQQTWITSGAIQNGVPITVFLLAIVSFDKDTKYSQDRFLPWKSLLKIFNL